MDKLMLIIAGISTTWYMWQIMLDITNSKRIQSPHIGFASISILSWWYFIPLLSFCIACLAIPYTIIIIVSKIKE
jgi:hypothetical protein